MKRFLFLIALYGVMTAKAQNIEIGGGVHYAYQHASNVGIDITAKATIADGWGFRLTESVNGFIPLKGFDRFGTIKVGVSYDILSWLYACADGGVAVNPSAKTMAGFTADAGAGATLELPKGWKGYAEVCTEFAENGQKWLFTPVLKVGLLYNIKTK